MRWLIGIGALLAGLTLLSPAAAGGGWSWDLGNGFGFASIALVLHLFIDSGRGRAASRHRWLAWLAVGAATLHGLYFIVLDATIIEYLKPTMPLYMAIGILGWVLLLVIVVTSLTRFRARLYPREGFRRLHWYSSVLLLAATGYHVIGSAFYYDTILQWFVFAGVLIGFAAWPRTAGTRGPVGATPVSALVWAFAMLVVVGVLLVVPRNL